MKISARWIVTFAVLGILAMASGASAADADLDGIQDGIDNCPASANQDQADLDGDGLGDACDPDIDGDGLENANDACPFGTLWENDVVYSTGNAGSTGGSSGTAIYRQTENIEDSDGVCPVAYRFVAVLKQIYEHRGDNQGILSLLGVNTAPPSQASGIIVYKSGIASQQQVAPYRIGLSINGVPFQSNDLTVSTEEWNQHDYLNMLAERGFSSPAPRLIGHVDWIRASLVTADSTFISNGVIPYALPEIGAFSDTVIGLGLTGTNDNGLSLHFEIQSLSMAPLPESDNDNDGLPNRTDNCPSAANFNQADLDGDGIGDMCDAQTRLSRDIAITGDVIIGRGGNLILNGHQLTVSDGALVIEDGAMLTMQNPNDTLTVRDLDWHNAAGDSAVQLTAGVINVSGRLNFYNKTGVLFSPSGGHTVRLMGDAPQTIYGADQLIEFQNLILDNPSVIELFPREGVFGLQVKGALGGSNCAINGTVSLWGETVLASDLTVSGRLNIWNGANLVLNGHTVTVEGDFMDIGRGLGWREFSGGALGMLTMQHPGDVLNVNNLIWVGSVSGDTSAQLTAGTINVNRDFYFGSEDGTKFGPTGSHTIHFRGTDYQRVDGRMMEFQNLILDNLVGVGFNIWDQWWHSNRDLLVKGALGGSNCSINTGLVLRGESILNGDLTVSGNLNVWNGGNLVLNGHSVTVLGDYMAIGTGWGPGGELPGEGGMLAMHNPNDVVSVKDFWGRRVGGDTSAQLTAGIINISRNFGYSDEGGKKFSPSGGHTVRFHGTAEQRVDGFVEFQNLTLDNPTGVNFDHIYEPGGYYRADLVVKGALGGSNCTVGSSLILRGETILASDLTVSGNMSIINGGHLVLNGHSLKVDGDYLDITTGHGPDGVFPGEGGMLTMQHPGDSVYVRDIVWQRRVGDVSAQLTAGIINVSRNFWYNDEYGRKFSPSGNHTVRFNGTDRQMITGSNIEFNNLILDNPAGVWIDIFDRQWNSPSEGLHVKGALGGSHCLIEGSLTLLGLCTLSSDLTVSGNLNIWNGGNLVPNGHRVMVNGEYLYIGTGQGPDGPLPGPGGVLTMRDAADVVNVVGLRWNNPGEDTATLLTAGTINIFGQLDFFDQTGKTFSPSGTRVVYGGLTVTPAALAFPGKGNSPSDMLRLGIANSSSYTMSISSALTGDNPSDFTLSAGTCDSTSPSLSGGSSCELHVFFAPQTAGQRNATLHLQATPGGRVFDVPLGGLGGRFLLSATVRGSGGGIVSEPGGIQCPGAACNAAFDQGTATLIAQPLPGHTFMGWSGACSGVDRTCVLRMDGPQTVGASFSSPNELFMVKDIQPGPGHSNPSQLTQAGEALFFAANDGSHGTELWRSDGTEAGTVLVMDITPGLDGTALGSFTVANGLLFFTVSDGSHGTELWRSDGTAAGTFMVKDINPGPDGSALGNFTAANGTLYFSANDGASGVELWKSDGSAAGTMLVMDINPGPETSSPANFTVVNGVLYFAANNGASGAELWKSDGSAAGTAQVKDIWPSMAGSGPGRIISGQGVIYFFANSGIDQNAVELWKSDGSEAGTAMIARISLAIPGVPWFVNYRLELEQDSLSYANGMLYFVIKDPGFMGNEHKTLWASDGTESGTGGLMNFGAWWANYEGTNIATINGSLYLMELLDNASKLWKIEGKTPSPVVTFDSSWRFLPMDGGDGLLHLFPTTGWNNNSAERELWAVRTSKVEIATLPLSPALHDVFELLLDATVKRVGPGETYSHIQEAVDVAAAQGGSSIVAVQPGVYEEDVAVSVNDPARDHIAIVALGDVTVNGIMSFHNGGSLMANGHRLVAREMRFSGEAGVVSQRFTPIDGLVMQDPRDSVTVHNIAWSHAGADTTTLLTAGTLTVTGQLAYQDGGGRHFSPSGSHTVRLAGNEPQTVEASFEFQNLSLANSFSLANDWQVKGDLTVERYHNLAINGHHLSVGGRFLQAGTLEMTKPEDLLDVRGTVAINENPLWNTGDIYSMAGGGANGDSGSAGLWNTEVIYSPGNAGSTGGSAGTGIDYPSQPAKPMTAGTIKVGGDFLYTTYPDEGGLFASSGSHTVSFTGTTPQQIRFTSATYAPVAASFQNMQLGGQTVLNLSRATEVRGLFKVQGSPPPTVAGHGFGLAAAGVDVDGLILDNAPFSIGDGDIRRFDNVTLQHYPPEAVQLSISHPALHATFANLNFTSPPGTGSYIAAFDPDGSDSPSALAIVDSMPADGTAHSKSTGGFMLTWGGHLLTDDPDADGDGVIARLDCNDYDATVYPGAPELCDGMVNDCNAQGLPAVELDADGDGYVVCVPAAGAWRGVATVNGGGDCNDADPKLHPGQHWYLDSDGDGYPDNLLATMACLRPVNSYARLELKALASDGCPSTPAGMTVDARGCHDETPPTISIGNPSMAMTRTGPVSYAVTYNDADFINLSADNIVLHATGSAAGTVSVTGSGSRERTVSISSVRGDGTLSFSIAPGTGSDAAGNRTTAAGPGLPCGVDNTLPMVSAGDIQARKALFSLTGTAIDANAMHFVWSKESGPGALSLGTATALETTVRADRDGVYVLRLTATDAAGNSAASDTALVWDETAPEIREFTLPVRATDSSLEVGILRLQAHDSMGITGYCLTETESFAECVWTDFEPASYRFSSLGNKTLYAWARDALGNVSAPKSAATRVVLIQKGDVNGDQAVNVADAVLLLKALARKPQTPPLFIEADTDGDHSLSVGDALYVLRQSASGTD